MLFLVITLPVCAAQSLEIKSFAGKDNVRDYARPDDSVTMSVEAMIPRDLVISESQMQVCRDSLCSFPDSCTPGESFGKDIYNNCVYTETLKGEEGIFPYSVKLSDDDGRPVKAVSTELGIDKIAPRILRFSISPETKGSALIEVAAQDYGSTLGDASYCTGIKQVDFYDAETNRILLSKKFGYEECDVLDSFEYTHKTGKKSEKISLCAKAIDLFGQESEPVCNDFVYDEEGPKFVSLGMADDDGNPISHIPSSGMPVDVVVEIDDVSELQSVSADLSKISGKSSDKNRKFGYKRGNKYYWSGFNVNPDTVCSASLTAVDVLGNKGNASLECSISVDDAGPEVQEMTSSYEDYVGQPVIAPGAQIRAKIVEDGVGLYKNEIYIDFSEIGLGTLQADSCEKKGAFWMCYWNDITPKVRDGDYQVRITENSVDDLGNKIFKEAGLDVVVYTKAARITAVSQYPVAPTYDDIIEFTVRVENSKTEPNVFVDASSVSTDAYPKEASCTSAGIDEWECYVDVDLLNQMYMKEMIVFSTKSGESQQEVLFEITVYEPEPEGGADFYTLTSTNILPKKGFDKRLVYNIPAPVYLQPKLSKKSGDPDVSIIETSADCTADGVSEIYLVPGNPENPYIVVKSSPAIAEQDTPVQVDCTLSLRVRQGQRIFKNLETETFSVKIPVYNNPLGTIGESAQAQIDGLNDRVWDLQKRTKRWSDINDWVGTIVGIAQALAQGDAVLTYVGGALWLIAVVFYELKSVPYIGPVLKALSKLLWKGIACGLVFTDIHTGILEYIWNPGMVGTEIFSADLDVSGKKLLATLIKTVSIIYSCQLCDYSSTLYAGTKKIVYGDTTFNIGSREGKPTEIERFTVYDWDPYRSIHVSMGCLCVPGMVYNMRKEVQVNCIYRNCIEQNAEMGLPFDSCQQTFKEQNCLYVDGAAWRVAGGSGIAFTINMLLTFILDHLPLMAASKAWSYVCDPECGAFGKEDAAGEGDCGKYGMAPVKGSGESAYPEQCRDYPADDWRVPLCGVWTSTMMLMETDFFGSNKFAWQRYTADLEGEDFCD
jgi:hypothetical protein